MYKILEKEAFSDVTKMMVVAAPDIAHKALPGEFVIIRTDERAERIPLTIADFDRQAGTITIVFQEVGKSTIQMGMLEVGDSFANVVGPLGHATEIENFGTVICVGGGVGIAPVYPIARALKEAGNHVISIVGARSKELLFWEDKMRDASHELVVCTDDGSYGHHGFVSQPLHQILQDQGQKVSRVWAIGPAPMMRACANTTAEFGVKTIVSLNTVMVDGTGMCGGCRVQMDDGARFVCVDGPEFDAHKVDWDLLIARQSFYREEERQAVERYNRLCQLETLA